MTAIGIALGAGGLRAALPSGRSLEAQDVQDLATALADLRKAVGLSRVTVTVALLPPLVDVRRVDLPPLREEERRRVLTRDAARHFLGVRSPQAIGIASGLPLVAAADAELVEAIERAVAAVGWSLRAIVPGQVAWARAKRTGTFVVRLSDAVELVRTNGGRLLERRRLRENDPLPEAVEVDAFAAAAAFAPRARDLELCSESRRATRLGVARRTARSLIAVAATCLVAAGAMDYWGLGRELSALRAHRAAIAPQLETAIQLRDSLQSLAGLVAALNDIERATPSWPALLAELADYLPRDAHLATLHTRGDSVSFTGVGREAGAVLRELKRISLVTGLRPDGPIRQEISATGAVREHFRLAAEWRP